MNSRTARARYIGIDPGTTRAGYGVVEVARGTMRYVASGVLPVKSRGRAERLLELYRGLLRLLDEHRPTAMGIEQLFFSTNQKTGIAVAEARGVLLLAAVERGVRIVELSPREMKFGITGYGGADKRAVQKMVRLILREPALRVIDDASDALALAILGSRKRPEDVG